MQDMIPRGDKSIRNIPVSSNHRRPMREPDEEGEFSTPVLPRRRSRRSGNFMWWALGVVLVAGVGGLFLSGIFEGAHITITPKTQPVTPPSTITAIPDGNPTTLGYQTMTVTEFATTTLTGNGTQNVSNPASGKIVIRNIYSAAPQELVANTRFESSDGKIYRIRNAVTVPGQKQGGAGEVTATIYADKPGADYNKPQDTTFTIPGFKGQPRYANFNAHAITAISGGFVGEQAAVKKEDLAAAQQSLRQQIEQAARNDIASHIPEGFMVVSGASTLTYTDPVQTQGEGNTVYLSQTATAQVAIVRTNQLASAVAAKTVSEYKGEDINFVDPSQISVSSTGTTSLTGPITLSLSGTPTLIWKFDEKALKQALLGVQKDSFQSIVRGFQPAIAKADATIRPFWESAFPQNPDKLTVTIKQ